MIMALATELLMVPVQPTQTHAKSGQRRHSVSVTSIEKPSPVHSVLFITKNAIKLYKVKMLRKISFLPIFLHNNSRIIFKKNTQNTCFLSLEKELNDLRPSNFNK